MSRVVIAFVGFLSVACFSPSRAAETEPDLQGAIDRFTQSYQRHDWVPKEGRPAGYMRPSDDTGWQARMLALQTLVSHPDEALPFLLSLLERGDPPQRILAAQALGYLGADVPAKPLVDALRTETDVAVRLYLVDTLGMIGQGDLVDWDKFLDREENRDIKRHVDYVRQRNGEPLEDDVRESLVQWDARKINTAILGQPAPDFSLNSVQGKQIKLSDYRGKQPVVLVFVYGDT